MIKGFQQKSIFASFEYKIFKSYNSTKTFAKYHVCNHCVIGEKTFKNILIGPGKLPGLSRNGPQITSSDALPLSYRRHVGPKAIELGVNKNKTKQQNTTT